MIGPGPQESEGTIIAGGGFPAVEEAVTARPDNEREGPHVGCAPSFLALDPVSRVHVHICLHHDSGGRTSIEARLTRCFKRIRFESSLLSPEP